MCDICFFFFSSRRRHTRWNCEWSSDVCSSDLLIELSRAAPDGYTLALPPNNPLTAQPHVQKLPYAMESFRYVCLTYFAPYVLIAGPQAPFKTFGEFIAFAKAKPENLVYGHAGLASQP